jgi:HK97 family phage prohead protease
VSTTPTDHAFRAERQVSEVRYIREQDPKSPPFEMREVASGTGGTMLKCSGYASVVDTPYPIQDLAGVYQEIISRKAFDRTLQQGADVAFLCNHSGVTMARTKSGSLKLSADATGLYSEATLDPSRADVNIVRSAVQSGDLDSMSFAFRAIAQTWSANYEERLITELSLAGGDVSVVNWPANEATAGLVDVRGRRGLTRTVRSGVTVPDYISDAEAALRQARLRHPPVRSTAPRVANRHDPALALARAKARGR